MKILVTADIHANLEALTAVLESAKGQYDGFISLGDMVGYGPDPEACIRRIKELKKHIRPCILLAGNHEAGVLKRLPNNWFGENARRSLKKTAQLISWKSRFFLAGLPPLYFLSEKTLLVHGSPLEPLTEYLQGGQETAISLRYLCAEGFTATPIKPLSTMPTGENTAPYTRNRNKRSRLIRIAASSIRAA